MLARASVHVCLRELHLAVDPRESQAANPIAVYVSSTRALLSGFACQQPLSPRPLTGVTDEQRTDFP